MKVRAGQTIPIYHSNGRKLRGTCIVKRVDAANNTITVDSLPKRTKPGDWIILSKKRIPKKIIQ